MIVTLTLNPSLDRAIEIAELTRGSVIRASAAHLDPGGKGVNVTRALLANGVPSLAVIPCGGANGDQLIRLLKHAGVAVLAVPVSGQTRSNVSLVEGDGTVTKINEPGAPLSASDLEAVAEIVLDAAGEADWVAMCGSLPPGVPVDVYAQLARRFTAAGIRVAVDTSGPALLAAVSAGPHLVKPNREELAEAVGAPLETIDDVIGAAQQLRDWGAGTVLASLGRHGAVLVDAKGVLVGESPVQQARSAVGAGDAMLAGFLSRGGGVDGAGPEVMREALAWAAAAVRLPGSGMPGPDDIRREAVQIHDKPDRARPLSSTH
ncbi:MAG: 1-phosphofructokinase [Frankia sp.]|nr:1-phosphofructokinase [Frankia sp.]